MPDLAGRRFKRYPALERDHHHGRARRVLGGAAVFSDTSVDFPMWRATPRRHSGAHARPKDNHREEQHAVTTTPAWVRAPNAVQCHRGNGSGFRLHCCAACESWLGAADFACRQQRACVKQRSRPKFGCANHRVGADFIRHGGKLGFDQTGSGAGELHSRPLGEALVHPETGRTV